MRPPASRALAVAAAVGAMVLAGCGLGPGGSTKEGARLDVTRDFGHQSGPPTQLAHVHASDTVMRFLEATHKVQTRYGGGFVQSVEGLAGDRAKQVDWFFYVNGFESDTGAADFGLSSGDRVQWDYHSWRATMRIPGIVGAYPEPFVHGYRGKRLPVRIECEKPDGPACREAMDRLTKAGVVVTSAQLGAAGDQNVARVVVATWSAMRRLQAASPLGRSTSESGVFARFAGPGGRTLDLLDANGAVARPAPPGTGLVAARVPQAQNVVWFVTGVDDTGVERAAKALDENVLRDKFAVAATPLGVVQLPVVGGQ
jgi:Domain of unknown function (DUF4430)